MAPPAAGVETGPLAQVRLSFSDPFSYDFNPSNDLLKTNFRNPDNKKLPPEGVRTEQVPLF